MYANPLFSIFKISRNVFRNIFKDVIITIYTDPMFVFYIGVIIYMRGMRERKEEQFGADFKPNELGQIYEIPEDVAVEVAETNVLRWESSQHGLSRHNDEDVTIESVKLYVQCTVVLRPCAKA